MDESERRKMNELQDRMIDFQNMAVSVSFEDAMFAFHGIEIDEKQKEILELIYKSTRPWVLGNNVKIMLEKLQSSDISGKDAKEISVAVSEYLQEGEASDPKGKKGAGGGLTMILNLGDGKGEVVRGS